ncbi:hypothetical protein COO59_16810 [Mixta theicola]|uniref:Uncharacterized protein n=1 Tax=Mixta theicola TaxID=1458355 RepID=A0A2K1Q698_9GAMM|nr:hypothetical protein [Mixta theicola]PNS10576.1 hypothetical protein COO59_16810 [Mixta theicola]GLR07372.1 hypothetical protein GCM10007905_00910 [Mixta theicola]
MKELSVTEIQAVSGAGRLQDALSNAYGNFFKHAATVLNDLFELGYNAEEAQQTGLDFGSRLGKALEAKFAGILDCIQTKVIG